jgi:hypothetical protein
MIEEIWSSIWESKHFDKNGIIKYQHSGPNAAADEGRKAVVDSFLINDSTAYFPETTFFVGLYYGSFDRTLTLLTIPGEPATGGYVRKALEHSTVGWPTIEQDVLGNWRRIPKEVTFTAVAGDIGPLSGAFLCTSVAAAGILVCNYAFPVTRTVLSGESITFTVKVKIK